MPRLVLDTNGYRAFLDGHEGVVTLVRRAEQIFLPVPVLGELRYGFANGTQGRRNEAVLVRFLGSPRVDILPCDEETTVHYAVLKLQLKRQGTPIPINDVWIAALVLQHRAELVTFDTDFERLPQIPILPRDRSS